MTPGELARRLRGSPPLRHLASLVGDTAVFVVGGALRDRALGIATRDLDLIVEAPADELARRLARALGGFAFPLGKPPDVTWRVACHDHQIDVWQPRGGLADDVRRRDFTVNAMLWRLPTGPLIDLLDGLPDLAAGRLEVIQEENLHSDPLRVLRGLRLESTRPQLMLTARSGAMLTAAAPGLAGVARERIVAELQALLAGPAVGRALRSGARLEVLAALVPAWRRPDGLATLLPLAGHLAMLQRSPGRLRLAASVAASAVLAAPAAGFPAAWETDRAARALERAGYPPRWALDASRAAAHGEALAGTSLASSSSCRERAVLAGASIDSALAWALARLGPSGDNLAAARRLHRWYRGFTSRAPLLGGEEIASLLHLPEGPARATAARALRLASARGEIRTRRQAVEFLTSHRNGGTEPAR